MHPLNIAARAGVFSASLIAAGGVIAGTVNIPGVDALARGLAYMAGFALGMLGVPASLDGAVINADGFVAVVASECTAIELILVFGAAVIVWPVSLKSRIGALLLGVSGTMRAEPCARNNAAAYGRRLSRALRYGASGGLADGYGGGSAWDVAAMAALDIGRRAH